MKITFSHFDLMYPTSTETCIKFVAETEFEKQWLNTWARTNKDMKFEFQHPCDNQPAAFNNPTVVIKAIRKEA